MKKVILICTSVLCLSALAGVDTKSKDFKVRELKSKLERTEIRAIKNSQQLTKIEKEWVKWAEKLKAEGVDISYDFVDVLK